ncbi:uncharacterized protein BXZ73DRAFT_95570 [Epithele typhae]|uniref:uncharacterized protein n=1 Tax=Epithele typhae TaxID=378194 RepID=UPI002007DD34|nr:uncharacterized protein BXZ73DRAFT_95570 [Epithele typhae]KAH9946063.1 hypothetical protein BXZ73DRAFT_95570 [Epithele typhae]
MASHAVRRAGVSSVYVRLIGLPRTALPNDLRRLCSKNGVDSFSHANIEYKDFSPTGRAVLTFNRPEYVPGAIKALNNSILSGKQIKAFSIDQIPTPKTRSRGDAGRRDAAQRGALAGDGLDAGLTGGAKNVLLEGLPYNIAPEYIYRKALRTFKISGADEGKPFVTRLNK